MGNVIILDKSRFKKVAWERGLERLSKKSENVDDPEDCHKLIIQGILYVVKANKRIPDSILSKLSYEDLEIIFSAKIQWLDAIKELTYREFTQIFPIKKVFDGARYEMKDYFTTIEYIEEHGGMSNKIEHPFEMLIDYNNFELSLFLVEIMSIMSEMNRKEKGKGLLEEFFSM